MDAREEAEKICANVNESMREQTTQLAENVIFLGMKLKATREKALHVDLVVPYDNGGGQTGFRKNPIFEAYNSMFAQYTKGLSLLNSILSEAPVTASTKSKLKALSKNVEKIRANA